MPRTLTTTLLFILSIQVCPALAQTGTTHALDSKHGFQSYTLGAPTNSVRCRWLEDKGTRSCFIEKKGMIGSIPYFMVRLDENASKIVRIRVYVMEVSTNSVLKSPIIDALRDALNRIYGEYDELKDAKKYQDENERSVRLMFTRYDFKSTWSGNLVTLQLNRMSTYEAPRRYQPSVYGQVENKHALVVVLDYSLTNEGMKRLAGIGADGIRASDF